MCFVRVDGLSSPTASSEEAEEEAVLYKDHARLRL